MIMINDKYDDDDGFENDVWQWRCKGINPDDHHSFFHCLFIPLIPSIFLQLKLLTAEDEKEFLREENKRLLRQLKELESIEKTESDVIRDFDVGDSLS